MRTPLEALLYISEWIGSVLLKFALWLQYQPCILLYDFVYVFIGEVMKLLLDMKNSFPKELDMSINKFLEVGISCSSALCINNKRWYKKVVLLCCSLIWKQNISQWVNFYHFYVIPLMELYMQFCPARTRASICP